MSNNRLSSVISAIIVCVLNYTCCISLIEKTCSFFKCSSGLTQNIISIWTMFLTLLVEYTVKHTRSAICVSFYDAKGQKISDRQLDLPKEQSLPAEPSIPTNITDITMEISVRYFRFSRKLLSDRLILISINPTIGNLDLKDEFIDKSESHFRQNEEGILYDFTKDFSESSNRTSIKKNLSLQCNKPGTAEVKVELRKKDCNSASILHKVCCDVKNEKLEINVK